ncbi:uncharacterized protein LOC144318534 isoform X6 [Canis aureus]
MSSGISHFSKDSWYLSMDNGEWYLDTKIWMSVPTSWGDFRRNQLLSIKDRSALTNEHLPSVLMIENTTLNPNEGNIIL